MRIILIAFISVFTLAAKAQSVLPGGFADQLQQQSLSHNIHPKDSTANKKWFLTKTAGMSTSFLFYNGGHATIVSAPFGVQLNRRLNNNWYAFAGVNAAPAYISLSSSYLSAGNAKFQQNSNSFSSNKFGLFTRAELGLMYVNDQKTFSISGSIGMERSAYPMLPFYRAGNLNQNVFIGPNR